MVLSAAAFIALPSACTSSRVLAPEDRLHFIATLASIVIPDTDTPGAGSVAVAQWVSSSLERGMRGGSSKTLAELEKQLDGLVEGALFRKSTPSRQLAALKELDDRLEFVPDAASAKTPWGAVKSLVLRAYYNSEVGASKELQYEPVPGRFDPRLPMKPGDRAWSTDVNARNFA